MDDVAEFAFSGLFMDRDEHVRWVVAQLAMDLSLYYRVEMNKDGNRDDTVDRNTRKQSLSRALERLDQSAETPLTTVPPAWVETNGRHRVRRSEQKATWDDADPSFDPQFAAKLFPLFPIEAWCQSDVYKPMVATALQELVAWTAERLMPSWLQNKRRCGSDIGATSLIEWNSVLGDLLARAAPYFETEFVRKEFLAPFLTEDEEGLAVLAPFAEMTVTRQVLDAPVIPPNTFDLLNDCVERVVGDRVFGQKNYRAGEVRGYDLPKLIPALLFVAFEKEAPGATRFANGDWSQVPIVTRLVTATGWSSFVMQKFLTLCELAGTAYPLDAFAAQTNAILGSIANAKAPTECQTPTGTAIHRLRQMNFRR
jgi:hypothetical protein